METLANWIHRRGRLAPRDAVGWAIRLAKHLEALHQHGVAHGHVSPACVVIENNDPRSRGQVADVRRTAEMVQYHSPERFRDGRLTTADDTWGVAAMLFTALTGARPFGELRPEIEARLPHGAPALGAYGVHDDGLQRLLSMALSPDPAHRISNVPGLRQQLEAWFNDPSVAMLKPLEDEETGEEDAAATAMLPMEQMFDDIKASQPDIFAPPSFHRAPGSEQGAPRPSGDIGPAPLGEQDATVMRELPAHIMAMAARAASGSNPPPPDPQTEDDVGGATRVAHGVDVAAAIQASRPGTITAQQAMPTVVAQHRAAHQLNAPTVVGQGPPSPRVPPGSAPRPQRPIRSTQLGVGMPQQPPGPPTAVAPPPQARPSQPSQPQGPPGPRPGFAPPRDTMSSAPPPPDFDAVNTVTHNAAEAMAMFAQGRGPQGQPAAGPQDDDDDGGRTMLREPPKFDEIFKPSPGEAQPGQGQWKPAPPPLRAASSPGATPHPAAPGGSAVSALIQETLEGMQGRPSPPGGGAPPGFPQPTDAPLFPAPGPSPDPWAEAASRSPAMDPGARSPLPDYAPNAAPGPFVPGPFQPMGAGAAAGVQPFGVGDVPLASAAGPGAPLGVDQPFGPAPAGGYPLGNMTPGAEVVAPERKKGSKLGLFIVCLLVLILAAAVTFIFLRYRHTLTFLPPELRGGP